MSYSQHYSDYKWIKVRRHKDDPSLSLEERLKALEQHHIEETTFLIEEVRRLAAYIDDMSVRGY